jgi:hypothetical protein
VPHNERVIDLRSEIPWLAGREVMAAGERAASTLRGQLERLGFSIRELEGERIVSDESLFDALQRAFGPEAAASVDGWEGLDRFLDQAGARLDDRVAVLWHRADASAFFSLRTVVEGVRCLVEWRDALSPDKQVEVVLLGQTRDFPQPEGS